MILILVIIAPEIDNDFLYIGLRKEISGGSRLKFCRRRCGVNNPFVHLPSVLAVVLLVGSEPLLNPLA
jgi:hypothetical protein